MTDHEEHPRPGRLDFLLGLAGMGTAVAGMLALVAGLVTFFGGALQASAGFFLAAALAFGLLANALFRR